MKELSTSFTYRLGKDAYPIIVWLVVWKLSKPHLRKMPQSSKRSRCQPLASRDDTFRVRKFTRLKTSFLTHMGVAKLLAIKIVNKVELFTYLAELAVVLAVFLMLKLGNVPIRLSGAHCGSGSLGMSGVTKPVL